MGRPSLTVEYPGDDPTTPPEEGMEWRGQKPVGGDKGSWYDPKTGKSWHPDLNHQPPIGPHWDYTHGKGQPSWRVFPDGSILPG